MCVFIINAEKSHCANIYLSAELKFLLLVLVTISLLPSTDYYKEEPDFHLPYNNPLGIQEQHDPILDFF